MTFSQQHDLIAANFDVCWHKTVRSKISDIQKDGPNKLKKIHIHTNYHFLFIRQWRTISIHPQLNLLSHSIHKYLFTNLILLINIIVHGINIDGYDTIGYKHMFYLLCLRMNLGYGPSNYIYVQNEYYLFVYVLLYINNYT